MNEVGDNKHCKSCGGPLTADDIGIYMKMVSRTETRFMCMTCFAKHLGCDRKLLEDRVKYYRESGNCVLFR